MTDHSSIGPMIFLLEEQLVIAGISNFIVSPVFDALFLYTDVLGYRCQFGPQQYMIYKFDRFAPDAGWRVIMLMGRIQDVINTLTPLGPFLTIPEIEAIWPPGKLED